MSLPLPNLDNRTYAELVEEARSLIPSEYAQWTDHNPTDPGIILIEMLAWLSEMVLYRVDRVPDKNIEAFLKLLNGPEWQLQGDLETAIRQTIVDLHQRYRAVSSEDFEQLVLEDWPTTKATSDLGGAGLVKRVRCLPEQNLELKEPQPTRAPGHVSLVVVPDVASDGESLGLIFDGKDDYLSVNAIQGLGTGNIEYTIEAWIYLTELPAHRAWILLLGPASPGSHHWLVNGNGVMQLGTWSDTEHTPEIEVGKWTHVATVYDRAQLKLYINGVLFETAIAAQFALENTALSVGKAYLKEDYFPGKFAELRIWNRVRQADEIQADLYRQLTGKEEGLVCYLPLDERTGDIAYDQPL
ncbi:MAG: LamG-like jellyroll fold domain-containing protein [Xenococcaceae cyanobacterium]